MANTFLKPETIASTALGLLQRELVLPRLVKTYGVADFAGAKNDTVTIRVPPILTARDYEFRTRSAPIQVDDIEESSIDVKLDKHVYHAGALTDENLTLDISNFGTQVLGPQVRAVAEALEGLIAAEMAAATYATTVTFAEGTDDPYHVAIEARKALNLANVPMSGRSLVLGADVEAAMLKTDKLVKANEAGSDSALREATIGRLTGFDVVTTNSIAPDAAYAIHSSAFVFGNVAPRVPDGVNFGASQSYQGLGMRWIRDYDAQFLRDRSVLSSFAGTGVTLDPPEAGPSTDTKTFVRAVKINFTPETTSA